MNPGNAFPGYDTTALCLWREARGEGPDGMQAVANVIEVRALDQRTSLDFQCMRPWQFSSMTDPNDKQLKNFPEDNDATWIRARHLAAAAKAHTLANIVGKATLYYNPKGIKSSKTITLPTGETIPCPAIWDQSKMQFTTKVQKHYFFVEL